MNVGAASITCTIHPSLLSQVSVILVLALICSRVDFGNMSSVCLGSSSISQFQSVLNAVTRLFGGISQVWPHFNIRAGFQFESASCFRSYEEPSYWLYSSVLKGTLCPNFHCPWRSGPNEAKVVFQPFSPGLLYSS